MSGSPSIFGGNHDILWATEALKLNVASRSTDAVADRKRWRGEEGAKGAFRPA